MPLPDPASARVCSTYKPHAAQLAMHKSRARFLNIAAGRRGGKTMSAAAEFVARAVRKTAVQVDESAGPIFLRRPKRLLWVVAPGLDLLREPTRFLFEFLPRTMIAEIQAGVKAGWRQAERRLWLPGDTEINFKTGEDPLSLVGVPLNGVWLTEAARLKADVWNNLRPALSDKNGWAIAETTPLGRNWLYSELWRRGDRGDPSYDPAYENHWWPTSGNPHVPAAELEQAKRDLHPAIYKREYEASFDAFTGQIYELHETTVCDFSTLPYREVVAGVDWGYASPGACVIAGIRADGMVDVLAEDYASGRGLPQWIAAFKQARQSYGVRRFYADPSSPMLIREARAAGLVVVEANNDVWDGIQAVQSLLHRKLLRIHSRCTNLVREMRGYRWSEMRGGGLREEPAPGQEDHAADSLRYLCIEVSRPPSLRAL